MRDTDIEREKQINNYNDRNKKGHRHTDKVELFKKE